MKRYGAWEGKSGHRLWSSFSTMLLSSDISSSRRTLSLPALIPVCTRPRSTPTCQMSSQSPVGPRPLFFLRRISHGPWRRLNTVISAFKQDYRRIKGERAKRSRGDERQSRIPRALRSERSSLCKVHSLTALRSRYKENQIQNTPLLTRLLKPAKVDGILHTKGYLC
ncbi:hypothetical protein LY78DRAFT_41645 [Colletotrichum sublineola]|nr:hypothetical protein LY78DRAFT_41645 [Colletotrichum sublineola]